MSGRQAWIERARRDREHTAVLTDFDGTLAEIHVDPNAVTPLPGVADLLTRLAGSYRTVAIVSGRPAAFLKALLPGDLELSGLYGLEAVRGGVQVDHPDAAPWRAVIRDVVADAQASGPSGMGVEPKGLSVTLHYRAVPDMAGEIRAWAQAAATRTGLEVRAAKQSVELHPPIPADKGTAIRALAEGAARACYLGDDLGDLPAFAALRELGEAGVDVLALAVGSAELDPAVRSAADEVVDGPAGARDFLASLID